MLYYIHVFSLNVSILFLIIYWTYYIDFLFPTSSSQWRPRRTSAWSSCSAVWQNWSRADLYFWTAALSTFTCRSCANITPACDWTQWVKFKQSKLQSRSINHRQTRAQYPLELICSTCSRTRERCSFLHGLCVSDNRRQWNWSEISGQIIN